MRKTLLASLAMLSLVAPALALAGSLQTAPSDNGSGGVFINLQPVDQSLVLTGFDVPTESVVGNMTSVEVWTRPGSYIGFTGSNAGWTLTQTVTGVTQGPSTQARFVLSSPIDLSPTGITAIYLHSTMSNGQIRYTGVTANPPETTWSNPDLVLFGDTARTGANPFAGTQFSPRTFSGIIRYSKTLDTAPANNGSGGVFLNLLPVNEPLTLKGFAVPMASAAGTPTAIEVWTRSGSYIDFTNSNTGWTLTQTLAGETRGVDIPVPFVLDTPIALSPTQVTAVYLHSIVPNTGIRYTGTNSKPPQTIWINDDLNLFSDTARTGANPFAGGQNSPRTFAGSLHYVGDPLFANGFED